MGSRRAIWMQAHWPPHFPHWTMCRVWLGSQCTVHRLRRLTATHADGRPISWGCYASDMTGSLKIDISNIYLYIMDIRSYAYVHTYILYEHYVILHMIQSIGDAILQYNIQNIGDTIHLRIWYISGCHLGNQLTTVERVQQTGPNPAWGQPHLEGLTRA
jgi:hypothetical protein